eukprot:scaffold35411_cov56-Attheya_sp.AAC.4
MQSSLTLIRPWVHHALVELLKNGMHASVQQFKLTQGDAASNSSEQQPPPMELHYSLFYPSLSIDFIKTMTMMWL